MNYDTANTSKELYRQEILGDKAVIIVRRGHPFDKSKIGVLDATDAEFACLIVPERSEQTTDIEKYFSFHNLTPTISFRSTSPETILQIVKQTDLLFPSLDIVVPDDDPDFRKIDVHIDSPIIDYSSVCFYHQSKHKDPLTQWLFGHIKQLHHELV